MEVRWHQEVKKFVASLEEPARVKVTRITNLLKTFGSQLGMPYSKRVNTHLFELRARGKQEIRIFYTFYESKAFLLHGFVKKTEKTPAKEIEIALSRWKLLTSV